MNNKIPDHGFYARYNAKTNRWVVLMRGDNQEPWAEFEATFLEGLDLSHLLVDYQNWAYGLEVLTNNARILAYNFEKLLTKAEALP